FRNSVLWRKILLLHHRFPSSLITTTTQILLLHHHPKAPPSPLKVASSDSEVTFRKRCGS
ncbi:hypothetical protein A2U01_0003006, partial [Trifolium medium]|nr:hypothetical protein [Trifolium medium]